MSSSPKPESRIRSRARSTILTGSPMSSTKISPHADHDVSPPHPNQPRLQNELHRFGNRHEVAHDLGIGDRYRTARGNLLAELGDHAARAAEHVAEAHHDEARPVGALQCLAHHL